MQRTNLRNAAARMDSSLESPLRIGDLAEELECVEEVRFPGCVGTNEEDTSLECHINDEEVAPVLKPYATELQAVLLGLTQFLRVA